MRKLIPFSDPKNENRYIPLALQQIIPCTGMECMCLELSHMKDHTVVLPQGRPRLGFFQLRGHIKETATVQTLQKWRWLSILLCWLQEQSHYTTKQRETSTLADKQKRSAAFSRVKVRAESNAHLTLSTLCQRHHPPLEQMLHLQMPTLAVHVGTSHNHLPSWQMHSLSHF